jgi:hypothetical protein
VIARPPGSGYRSPGHISGRCVGNERRPLWKDRVLVKRPSPPSLLSVRTLLILVTALCCGTAVGMLSLLGDLRPAAAVLAGLGTVGTTIAFLHRNVDT